MLTNKNSSNHSISSNAYTYYSSGASTDLIQTETITNGEPIDNFVAGTTGYTPNTLNQLESTTNPTREYEHDFDGNMTTGFTPEGYTLTMAYDAENRMKTAEYTDSQSILHKTEYSYSGDSLLAEMKKYDGGSLTSTTKYLRAGFLPIQERGADNSITREYVWGMNLGGGIGGLLNLRQNSNDYSYLYDGKGNVAALFGPDPQDNQIKVVANYRYDPFGNVMKKSRLEGFTQPYMFSTKQYDSQTGQYYYGYRFYDPVGKWTTRDPLGEAGGINLYKALGNSPTTYIDPDGLMIMQLLQQLAQYGQRFSQLVQRYGTQVWSWISRFGCRTLTPDLGTKLDYFLGRASGNIHSVERSTQMLQQLQRIGLYDNPGTRKYLTEHLSQVLNNPSNIVRLQENGRAVRESLLMGPNGSVKIETVWEGTRLITGNIFGGP